jgi:hypothetical protein
LRRVCSLIPLRPCKARSTVPIETLASFAISRILILETGVTVPSVFAIEFSLLNAASGSEANTVFILSQEDVDEKRG